MSVRCPCCKAPMVPGRQTDVYRCPKCGCIALSGSKILNSDAKEVKQILSRITMVKEYLENTDRKTFTPYEVEKMVKHIREGGGWL